jgi:hypothetical protein
VLGSIVENCTIGDAIRRNKASEVHKFGVRLMPELYDSLHPMTCKRALQAPKKLADDLEPAIQAVTPSQIYAWEGLGPDVDITDYTEARMPIRAKMVLAYWSHR